MRSEISNQARDDESFLKIIIQILLQILKIIIQILIQFPNNYEFQKSRTSWKKNKQHYVQKIKKYQIHRSIPFRFQIKIRNTQDRLPILLRLRPFPFTFSSSLLHLVQPLSPSLSLSLSLVRISFFARVLVQWLLHRLPRLVLRSIHSVAHSPIQPVIHRHLLPLSFPRSSP